VVVRVAHPYRDASPPDRPPLQPGMLTQVTLSAASPKPRLVVPAAAVHPATEDAKHADGDQPLAGSGEGHRTRLVYRLDAEDRLRHTPVEVAFEQGGLAVIAAGLAPGDRVIVDDPLPAIDGMQVNPCPDPALEARLKDEAQAPAQAPQPAQTSSAGATP
jgi:hypothetical protein